jgi:hypothetical protein
MMRSVALTTSSVHSIMSPSCVMLNMAVVVLLLMGGTCVAKDQINSVICADKSAGGQFEPPQRTAV